MPPKQAPTRGPNGKFLPRSQQYAPYPTRNSHSGSEYRGPVTRSRSRQFESRGPVTRSQSHDRGLYPDSIAFLRDY